MQNEKHFYLSLAAIFCVLIITLGWVYSVQGTTIGTNISTVNITTSGEASTTGDFYVTGNTILSTSTIGSNFYIDSTGNASTTGTLVIGGSTSLATTTATNITLGSGTIVTKLMHGTIAINPPAIATSSTELATSSLTGATADMKCFVQPPSDLNDDLIPKGCTTTAGIIGVYLYNPDQTSGGTAINDGSKTWGYLLIK